MQCQIFYLVMDGEGAFTDLTEKSYRKNHPDGCRVEITVTGLKPAPDKASVVD